MKEKMKKENLTLKGSTMVKIKLDDKSYSHLGASESGELPPMPITVLIDKCDAIDYGFTKNKIGHFNDAGMDGAEVPLTALASFARRQAEWDFCREALIDLFWGLCEDVQKFVILAQTLLNEKGQPSGWSKDAEGRVVVHPDILRVFEHCNSFLQDAEWTNGLEAMSKGNVDPDQPGDLDEPRRHRPKLRSTANLKVVQPEKPETVETD